MQPKERFRDIFEARLESEGGMACREELISAVERSVRRRGQYKVLDRYLRDTFKAERMADLIDDDLERALQFIALLEEQTPSRQLMPIVPGMEADGEACWFRGRMIWESR